MGECAPREPCSESALPTVAVKPLSQDIHLPQIIESFLSAKSVAENPARPSLPCPPINIEHRIRQVDARLISRDQAPEVDS